MDHITFKRKTMSHFIFPIALFILGMGTASVRLEIIPELEINEPENVIFNGLKDIAVDSEKNIYVLDKKECLVYVFNKEGTFLRKIGSRGNGPGEFGRPISIFVDSVNKKYVLDGLNRRIEVFDSRDNYTKSIKIIDFPLGQHHDVGVDKDGNLYISGYYRVASRVLARFSPKGELIKYLPAPAIEYNDLPGLSIAERESVNQQLSGGSLCFGNEGTGFFS